jgi:hypothetical protein
MNMKKKTAILLSAVMVALTATGAPAQEQPTSKLQALEDALPGTLINDPTKINWVSFGSTLAVKTLRDDNIPGGKAANQYTISKAGTKIYDAGANVPIKTAIKKDTDIVVGFYARTISADTPDAKGRIGVRIQQNESPFDGFGDASLSIGKEWNFYELPIKSTLNIPRGKVVVALQLAGAKQVIEIGQMLVVSDAKSLRTASTQSKQSATTDLLPQLVGKGKLISNPANKDWIFYGSGGVKSIVPSPNIPGTGGKAMLVKTAAAGANPYDVGANVPLTEAVAEGDVLLIGVLARTAPDTSADGSSKLDVRVQLDEAPYPGFGSVTLQLGPTWKLLQFKATADKAIPAGKGVVTLHFASAAQSIEVGQVYVLKTPPTAQTKP